MAISTIDSFLSSIVSPWMGLVCEDVASEQVDEDGAIFLRDEAIRTAWRLQRGIDGFEAGMSGDIETFLESRDRLSILLGGQESSAKVIKGEDAVQEDLLFHLAIAKASANPTINTFMLKITPEIITNFEKHHVCDKDTAFKGIEEHKAIIDAIRNQDPDQAKIEMKKHFKDLYQYCYNI